jgi:hypothetical protein
MPSDAAPVLHIVESLTRVFVRRLPKRDRLAFLREVSEDLRWSADAAHVVRLRSTTAEKQKASAKVRAVEIWEPVADRIAETVR